MKCFYLYLLAVCVWSAVVEFPEPTDEITGLRSAGTTTESKQRNIWRRVSKIANNIQKAKVKQYECDDCLKRGSGAVTFHILPDIITQKKQYSRGIENRITYDIYSKSDIPQTFYSQPFVNAPNDIMASLLYSIQINEAPLHDFEQAKSLKNTAMLTAKQELFKLAIQAEQPLSALSEIQADYKKSGVGIITAYNKLNGINTLPHVAGADLTKFKQKYELNKPYYFRKAVGDIPVILCNEYIDADLLCTNKYLLVWRKQASELQRKVRVEIRYPLIPNELVIAPTLLIKYDSPNLKTHSIGYKKWWDCSNRQLGIEKCVYKLDKALQKFSANDPIQGTVRIGKGQIAGNWKECGTKTFRQQNRELCSIKLKDIWPSTVTRIKVEIMHPPKYEGEYAAIEFEQVAPKVHYFTTEQSPTTMQKIMQAVRPGKREEKKINSKMKNICYGDITTCSKKYAGGTTARIAGSQTNRFLSRLWSKSVTLKLQNRGDKLPLQSQMFYKMKATFLSSTIWRKYLGFSLQPPFVEPTLVFDLKAPKLGMVELECQFEPKQVLLGQNVEVFISVKNKQNGFRRSKLRSIYRLDSRLTNKYQNIDVVLTPIGNGNGDADNIGLAIIKNVVQIRKRDLVNVRHRELTPAKFKVVSVGKQCVSFEIKGVGKTYYVDKAPECIDVVGALKAEYVGVNDINRLINDEQSDKFKLIIKTGNEAKLQGNVVLTPNINGGIKGYEFNIDPPILNTGNCKRDCVLPFDFTSKLVCAMDDSLGVFEVNAEISWTVSYLVNGRNVYFPQPSAMKLVILEKTFDSEELAAFQEQFPAKYERWKKCGEAEKDLNPLPACNEIEIEDTNTNNTDNCIPIEDIDDDDEILKEIQSEKIKKEKDLKWYNDFWQKNWNWQYAVIGSATVFIAFGILTQLGCIGGESILLEMLKNVNAP